MIRSHSACIWCWDKPRANSDSQDTPRPGFGRCHHHTPYSILCVRPREWHPNGSFSQDSQSGVPKLSRVGVPGLWDVIAPRPNLWSGRGLNQSCSPQRELSNAMSHSRSARRKQVDSWLLVVGSQIASLTPGHSFAHNLGYRCPNGSCEAILDICTSRPFQWHQERSNARRFDACNCALSFWESRRTPTSHFWECGLHPHTQPKVGLRQFKSITWCMIQETHYDHLWWTSMQLDHLQTHKWMIDIGTQKIIKEWHK